MATKNNIDCFDCVFRYTPKDIKVKIINDKLFKPNKSTSVLSGMMTFNILYKVYKKNTLITNTPNKYKPISLLTSNNLNLGITMTIKYK